MLLKIVIFHPHSLKTAKVIRVCPFTSQARFHIWSHVHLSQRGGNYRVLLQLKELANEVLLCETQGLQLTQDLLKYLQKKGRITTQPTREPTVLPSILRVKPCQTWSCLPRPGRRQTCYPCPAVRKTGSAGCWSPEHWACSSLRWSQLVCQSCRGGLWQHDRTLHSPWRVSNAVGRHWDSILRIYCTALIRNISNLTVQVKFNRPG